MARFYNLFSSSKGNCSYIGNEKSGILIDCGANAKQISLALAEKNIDSSAVKAVFVTHEHTDHVSGLRVFCSRNHVPVFASKGTYEALSGKGMLDGDFFSYVIEGETAAADFAVSCFPISHDCAEGCGYTVETKDGRRLSVCTDTGCITPEIAAAVKGSDLVLLESNHEVGMLMAGRYPYPLKMRILSDRGHLSNESCAAFAKELVQSGTTRLILGHLSQENNIPDSAYQATCCALSAMGAELNRDYMLSVASPRTKGDVFVL